VDERITFYNEEDKGHFLGEENKNNTESKKEEHS
jgi:hypothetical protein